MARVRPPPQLGEWIKDLAAQHRAIAGRLAERQGPAFPAWTSADGDAILQPPNPQIQPSSRILERGTDRDLDMEAAD